MGKEEEEECVYKDAEVNTEPEGELPNVAKGLCGGTKLKTC